VTDHVFCDENGVENLPVVNKESLPDKLRSNRGTAGPSLDWALHARIVDLVDFFEEMLLHERPLF
jgi:hypothetical protein